MGLEVFEEGIQHPGRQRVAASQRAPPDICMAGEESTVAGSQIIAHQILQ
jgi:hypothetical protein